MPFRFTARDSLHLQILQKLADDYDIVLTVCDNPLQRESKTMYYWFYMALLNAKIEVIPKYYA